MKNLLILLFSLLSFCSFSQETKKITLDDIYKNRKFASRGVYGLRSMQDGIHYSQVKNDSLNIYEYSTGNLDHCIVTAKSLVPAGDTTPISMMDYSFSSDEKRILFATDDEPIYRRSSRANYYLYEIPTGRVVFLSPGGKMRLATFSPDGSRVAFVRDNNLFVINIDSLLKDPASGIKNRISNIEHQLTFDGKINHIINGATDWVYEEEFEFSQAYAWGPDSRKIAWYQFDESNVMQYQLTYYGDLYPEQYKYKYPKAGESNSRISLFIRDLVSGITKPVDIGTDTNIYIPRILWTQDPNVLSFYRMNRHQDHLELMLADAVTGSSKLLYDETNKAYIEIHDHLYFLKNKKQFILTSEKDGYRHIYLYDMSGKMVKQLTTGNWEVQEIVGMDEPAGRIYFTAAYTSPMDRDLFFVTLDGKKLVKLSQSPGSTVPEFSTGCKYYLSRYSDINTPPFITLNDADGKQVRVLQDNAKLKDNMKLYGYSRAEFWSFRTEGDVTVNGLMLKPADFDPNKKYPVLFTIYGGPGYQTVTNSWGAVSSWNQLWAQNGIIVVSVDNRGTGGRGEAFKKCTYLQLGKYETIDQIEAAKYLGSLPYVDKDRIGMWGWSFGGYLTLSCLTKGADYFSFGIAVAPVTNWKYYDNIYTERYMRTPAENSDGYESNSPLNFAAKLKGKLLLIHGMADDNVHPQNSYDFITALVAANKQFELQLYPNSNHGIYTGKNTTFHLYNRMTEFILKNL
jgi:dipeptidyl-peptidase 4